MVAFSSTTGEQVGWTLMCSSTSIVADDFAFLPLCPSCENTGLIACVGVERSARGKGVGLALLVRAMENLRGRGVKGVLIDVSFLPSLLHQLRPGRYRVMRTRGSQAVRMKGLV